MANRLPRAPSGEQVVVMTGRIFNRIADAIDTLFSQQPAPGGTAPVLCKITSNATGAGYYNARRQIRKQSPTFDPTSALTMSTYYQDMKTSDDIYVANNGDSGHSVPVGTYLWCEQAGPSTSGAPRMVYSVLGGNGIATLSPGQYQGMVYTMVTDNQAGWSLPFLVPEI